MYDLSREHERYREILVMPIYEYECTNCGERFELLRSIADSDEEIKCPKCDKKSTKRVVSMFGTVSSNMSCAPGASSGST
jgi:putative FmdB family regulatory protein